MSSKEQKYIKIQWSTIVSGKTKPSFTPILAEIPIIPEIA